jgi:hypothetical protein
VVAGVVEGCAGTVEQPVAAVEGAVIDGAVVEGAEVEGVVVLL